MMMTKWASLVVNRRVWEEKGKFGKDYSSRYGMNGQEKDNEVGEGIYTAEFWEYDSKIARRWNLDPKIKLWESPYASFANNPIWFTDPNGADTTFKKSDGTYDKQAQNDFNKAQNQVLNEIKINNDKIGELKDKAIEKQWSAEKLSRKLSDPQDRISELNKLKDDFDYICSSSTPLITYSSDITGFKPTDNGKITMSYADGVAVSGKIWIRPGKTSTVIHENRHTRQAQSLSTFDSEVEAYKYQRIFSASDVQYYIDKAKMAQYPIVVGTEIGKYDIEEMVKWVYKTQ